MHTLYQIVRTKLKLLLRRGVSKSYSQFGEDMVVKAALRSVTKGFYIDIGAFDPVLYSNTYAFYKKGWHGLVIDPNSTLKPLYALERPRDTFVLAGVGKEKETREYHRFNDESYNTFDTNEAMQYLKTNKNLKETLCYPVNIVPLSQILKDHPVTKIDFLSIDAQGMDLSVLQSHDWNIKPTVIAVESDFNAEYITKSEVYMYLAERGYTLVGVAGLTLLFKLKQ